MPESTLNRKMVASIDKKLRHFAFTLALIEKAASTLGTMNFIWATVVLLGGFSQSLKSIDFWFVGIILAVEGLRILGRRSEVATRPSWYPNLNLSFPNLCRRSEVATRPSWYPNLSFPNLSFSSIIHMYSLAIQEFSAIGCIVLSSLRIHRQQYGSDHHPNRDRALNLFYLLSIVESSLTLFVFVKLPRPFLRTDDILSLAVGKKNYSVLRDNGFEDSQRNMFMPYFYDTYCRCINGSVFDGLKKTNFLSYSVERLQSIDDNEERADNEQLAGARLLSLLLKSDSLGSEELWLIRTMPGVLERLIELLNWEKPQKQVIRIAAGEIICKLVEIPRHRIRVMAIPESMESITSLLYDRHQIAIHSTEQGQSAASYDYTAFSMLGKRILKSLAKDPDNHAKIGTNRGLRGKIIALERLKSDALEADIIGHLERMETETETLADQQDVPQNIEGTSGFEAEHSNDLHLQSISVQA